MCLAIPGKVIKIDGHKILIQYPAEERQALIGNEALQVGDFVMVQMGIVIKVLTEQEAVEAQQAWNVNA